MVRLKNIERNNQKITCDVYPEDSKKAGMLSVDITSGDYVYTLPEGYEWCRNHVMHAKTFLNDTIKDNKNLPNEKLIMWG